MQLPCVIKLYNVEYQKYSHRNKKRKNIMAIDLKPTLAATPPPPTLTFTGTPRNRRITWPQNRFNFFSSSRHHWTWPSQQSDFNVSGSDSSWFVKVFRDLSCFCYAASFHRNWHGSLWFAMVTVICFSGGRYNYGSEVVYIIIMLTMTKMPISHAWPKK